jgi:branched-chain amino acid aminotransferase
MKPGICYVNGSFVPASEAKVSIYDSGFTSGDGVYDVTRTFGHQPFKLDQHIARLFRSLRYTHIDCGMTPEEVMKVSLAVFERNVHLLDREDDCMLWQVISRGNARLNKPPVPATVVLFCVPMSFETYASDYLYGRKLMTPSTRRTPPQSLEAKSKITNRMNHSMAVYEAQQVDPQCWPLMLDIDGNIAETQTGNFFFVSGGKLCTSTDRNVLGGITRTAVIALARKLGITVVEDNFTPYDVYTADEAFISSTPWCMLPVKSLNGTTVGKAVPGPMTLRLIKAWSEMVGLDIVGQALAHLDDRRKQGALGEWAELRDR